MAKSSITFTQAALRDLLPEPGRRVFLADKTVPGLGIYVTPAGIKSFFLQKSLNGKQIKFILGRWLDGPIPDMTIKQARVKAQSYIAMINNGVDPHADRRSQGCDPTWGEFFRIYLTQHSKTYKKTWRSDQGQYDNHLKHWSRRRLSSISRQDVAALYVKLLNKVGVATANRVKAQVSHMFNYATDMGLFSRPNPALRIKMKRTPPRQRVLEKHEFPAFFRAVCSYRQRSPREAILLCLFTGARKSNVLGMRWEDVCLSSETWKIPETKTGDSHTVPLIPVALEILQARQQDYEYAQKRLQVIVQGDRPDGLTRSVSREMDFLKRRAGGPWVFYGKNGNSLTSLSRPWGEIISAAATDCPSIADLWIHDLRRTMGSWQARTGASLAITSKSLAHKNIETTRKIYAIVDLDPMRGAMSLAVDAMEEMGDGKLVVGGSEVVTEEHHSNGESDASD